MGWEAGEVVKNSSHRVRGKKSGGKKNIYIFSTARLSFGFLKYCVVHFSLKNKTVIFERKFKKGKENIT